MQNALRALHPKPEKPEYERPQVVAEDVLAGTLEKDVHGAAYVPQKQEFGWKRRRFPAIHGK